MTGKQMSAGMRGADRAHPLADITAEEARALWAYDPDTGVLTWRTVAVSWRKVGDVAGGQTKQGYIVVGYGYRLWRAHRLAWLIVTGEWPKGEIDHADGQKANNAWLNLRDVPKSLNQANVPLKASNTSGFKGVSWNKHNRRWGAAIQKDGRQRHLGYFANAAQAHAAYVAAANDLFGEHARVA